MRRKHDAFIAFKAPAELDARLRRVCPRGQRSEFVRNAVIAAVVQAERKGVKR